MKILIFGTLFLSSVAFAREDLRSFHDELFSDSHTKMEEHDYKLREKPSLGRGPASVKPRPRFESAPKIDKNVKQMGHADW